jgi:outer membrane cobalamin receptor
MMSTYHVLDGRGYYVNAELNYKYRSLLEAKAAVKYAPHDNELFVFDNHYNGYKLGVDRASTVANIDLKVTPWKPLSVNVGLDYRGGRMALFEWKSLRDWQYEYGFEDMDDVIELHAGASYRVTSRFTLWTQAHNLLNRRYDILYGQGAQRIGIMAGLSLTF